MPTSRVHKSDEYDMWAGRDYHDDKQWHLGVAVRTGTVKSGWLGNPYPIKRVRNRQEAVDLFERDLELAIQMVPWVRYKLLELYGKKIACYCEEHQECHADVIVRKANAIYWKNKTDSIPTGKTPNVPMSEW